VSRFALSYRIGARGLALGLALGLAGSATAEAQTFGTVDAGATRLSYGEHGGGFSVFSVSPALQVSRPSAALGVGATFSQFAAGGWSVQGVAAGSVLSPALSSFRLELAGSAGGSVHKDGTRAGQLLGQTRLHWMRPSAGLWLGAGVALAARPAAWLLANPGGTTTETTFAAELGGWARLGPAVLAASWSPTDAGGEGRWHDVEGAMRVVHGALELTGSAGLRRWAGGMGVNEEWTALSGAVWLGEHVALVGGVGTYPQDVAQGLARGTYGSLAVRLATGRPGAPRLDRVGGERTLPEGLQPVVPAFETRAERAGRRIVEVEARDARSVELMADFTDWQPVPLQRGRDGRWSITLPVAPGTYRLNLRVDGGEWGVPPGLPTVADDFGGAVGLLVVE
jgi:hypothetical protein